ncbi:N-acetylmuramoyl-L-alanine amidase [Prochlorococcus marinus]|uniref:N-acetylmuramoyl-L-alanine amidase n=1 Tax=Prochlorococcus marinus XMU1408 TaxID=2213228 RepID=A0A318R1E2_PROMR|nr:N-acetylmuramoyl-L-alanine amidase [Prochlorococcus marinus]MBW3042804.1 N-acetylmuramoyl-L-alanine amidase [Prochlorococcus marinus str. XMU1408]PYE00631.1 N-acetylmuramoyl-L-alanine amidase [Prochlorococcus marinus XMU1408]
MRNKLLNSLKLIVFLITFYVFSQDYYNRNFNLTEDFELIIGESSNLPAAWVGSIDVDKNIPILILAGHADSQGLAGAGTPGEAVDKFGLNPMDPEISDELFWNLKLQESIVKLGKKKGLNISSYDPGIRNIDDANDPRTNWSVGRRFAKRGGYAIEIHFDAYGKYGVGSGLIPPFSEKPNKIDESIARTFGRFPVLFRGGLGAPRRQIRILEIGKLEGLLEKNLRNLKTRQKTIKLLANEIVQAFLDGII